MNIIIEDSKLGKKFLIKGHGLDWELFSQSKGEKRKGEWTTMRLYPTTLPYAVYKVLCLILADPDDDEAVCIEAEKARIKLGKVINDRLDKIMVSIEGENNES